MNIRNIRELKRFAAERLDHAGSLTKLLGIYIGAAIGLGLSTTVITYVLNLMIDNTGGLSNMGTRTILSTLQMMLPLVQSMVSVCLNVGFLAAMLRIARGQYVSHRTLKLGFDRFWVLLRSTLLQSLLLMAYAMLALYLGMMIFMMTPWWNGALELLAPYLTEASLLSAASIEIDEAIYQQFSQMLLPAYGICGLLAVVFCVPLLYSYRMVNYVIIDKPGLGAMTAMRESKFMMRGKRFQLFQVDLSLWWYYAALVLASLVGYGDVILSMLGISLPGSADVWYFVFYGLYLAATAAIYYFLLTRVETTYALVYDAIKPQDKQDKGVVLGNIFQM